MTSQFCQISADVLCELAHELTVRECAYKRVALDVETEDEVTYTDAAQDIFNEIYDLVWNTLAIDGGRP